MRSFRFRKAKKKKLNSCISAYGPLSVSLRIFPCIFTFTILIYNILAFNNLAFFHSWIFFEFFFVGQVCFSILNGSSFFPLVFHFSFDYNFFFLEVFFHFFLIYDNFLQIKIIAPQYLKFEQRKCKFWTSALSSYHRPKRNLRISSFLYERLNYKTAFLIDNVRATRQSYKTFYNSAILS
jgi:hypothetical protein